MVCVTTPNPLRHRNGFNFLIIKDVSDKHVISSARSRRKGLKTVYMPTDEEWTPLSIDSELEDRPSSIVSAPITGSPILPFDKLSWKDFERIQVRILRDVEGLRNAQLYGRLGQTQHGLDIIAVDSNQDGVALQSKKYKRFTASDLQKAVEKFRTTTRPIEIKRFIIGVACEANDTTIVDAFQQCQRMLYPVLLELWDNEELSVKLRGCPEIVIDFFGTPTAEKFCRPFTLSPIKVPEVNAVVVSEAIVRTPEKVTGADEKFKKAHNIRNEDPARALNLFEKGQQLLRESGFQAHAMKHETYRTQLLITLGRAGEAARTFMNEIWIALEKGRVAAAEINARHLRKIANDASDDEQVNAIAEVARHAVDLTMNPLGRLLELDYFKHDGNEDWLRLAVLAGEIALANDRLDWLKKASSLFSRFIDNDEFDETQRIRARLLLAEATEDWSGVLGDARRRRIGYALGSLVIARYARHQAIHQQFREADALWDEAVSDACLARCWTDAQTWTFSRRAFRSRWTLDAVDELLPVEIALGEMESSDYILTKDNSAYTTALEMLRVQNLRPAAIAAQRALRQTISSADWVGEERARRVLGAVLGAANEPEAAARHLARAADVSGMKDLAAQYTDRYIDIEDSLDVPNYWTVGTAYSLLSAEADFIPNEMIEILLERILGELKNAENGTLIDPCACQYSRYLNAIKVLSETADRLTVEQAKTVLIHFEKQSDIDSNHYRLHDEDEAITIARIALSQPLLQHRAIAHLVPLMSRSQKARKSITMEALADSPKIAQPCLEEQVRRGVQWAQEALIDLFGIEGSVEESSAAFNRLASSLEHVPGMYEIGTNAIGDSIMIRSMSAERRGLVIDELLKRSEDTRVALTDRGDYLLAASNLVEGLDELTRRKYCEAAIRIATDPVSSEFDDSQAVFAHRLGAVRMSFDNGSTPTKALYLAACLAVDEEQHVRIKHLTYQLFGSDDRSSYWPTRVLQKLRNTGILDEDLGFLAGQGWASRSLAAIIWTERSYPSHLGLRLATDIDPRVRRDFAEALAKIDPTPEQTEVRQLLENDLAYSVRKFLIKAN